MVTFKFNKKWNRMEALYKDSAILTIYTNKPSTEYEIYFRGFYTALYRSDIITYKEMMDQNHKTNNDIKAIYEEDSVKNKIQ